MTRAGLRLPESPTAPQDQGPLRLHLNENPYGCSLLVQESLSIYDHFAQMPGPLPRTLTRALSRYAGRAAQEIHLANSPQELLHRVLSTTLRRGQVLPAYGPVPNSVRVAAEFADVQMRTLDGVRERVSEAVALAGKGGTPAVYLASPNHVTGQVVAPLEVVALLRAGLTVIADETYAEFADKTLTLLGREFTGLVSLRSFAPWAGLWGIPASYALASRDLVSELDSRWPPSTVSAATRIAAGASLDDSVLLLNRVKHIRLERARLYRRLRKLNFVQPLPSGGPFLPCVVTRSTAERVCELLEREGVLVHNGAEDGMPGYIRVSVGLPEHTDQLISAMCRISVQL